jgi:menaquinone-dependent protoporphyrinogen IX oxidase
MRKKSQVYFLPGKLVYQNLSWSDKFMLRMGAMLTKDKKIKKQMLTDYNGVKKENLDVLVKDIKNYTGRVSKPVLQL